ncbi:glycosyltransferase family 9 protein [Candidatus Kaiserbacteria bacterium]|nr:glycosyltransferase family 9 protein [Candidatus Kaiserbacteria bacterium]
MFSAIKRTYPSAQVCVIGNSINKEVLGDHPDVDDYCVWNGAIREMAREIRRRGIEYLCITGPSAGALAAAYLAGVPRIVVPVIENGLSPYETRAYKLLRLLAVRIPHCMGHYAPREYLRLLEPLSIVTDDTTKRINYSDAARKNAAEFLRAHHLIEKKFAVISPSAGNKIKNWPADRFARVAEHLVSRDLPVVVIGGPRDKEEVAAMMRVVGTVGNIIDASEKFSIDELKAFIAQALLFVSSDTGPIYIAEAFNIATVDIIGPIDENEQPPVGSRHKIVVAPRQKPQLFVMNARFYDAREARRQVEAVTVPMVIEAIDELLRENRLTI